MSIVNLYIPRIHGSVTKNFIRDTFHKMNIGKVTCIDMHRKKSEYNKTYYYSFITMKLYKTFSGYHFNSEIETSGIKDIMYDETNNYYWEVKKHVPKTERHNKTLTLSNDNDTSPPSSGRSTPSSVCSSKSFKSEIENDYLELEYEMLQTNLETMKM
jgi:hypothetical protein